MEPAMIAPPGQEILLSSQLFAYCLLGGAAAIALWVDVRFPRLAPQSMRAAMLHIGATLVVAQIVLPLATSVLTGSRALALLATFAVALPSLVYCLISAIWVIRLAHAGLRGRFH
jgi:hypothetical protein